MTSAEKRTGSKTVHVPEGTADEATQRATTRLTADLPTQDAATLRELAASMGFNRVTTLVRAIRVLSELWRAERDGGELTIKYRDGHRERLLLR